MEFMSWDWFSELRVEETEEEAEMSGSNYQDDYRSGRITAAQYMYRAYVESLLASHDGTHNIVYYDDDDSEEVEDEDSDEDFNSEDD